MRSGWARRRRPHAGGVRAGSSVSWRTACRQCIVRAVRSPSEGNERRLPLARCVDVCVGC
eukprot:scaffold48152_cov69-Phaeocystis_antarctica.AAC.2